MPFTVASNSSLYSAQWAHPSVARMRTITLRAEPADAWRLRATLAATSTAVAPTARAAWSDGSAEAEEAEGGDVTATSGCKSRAEELPDALARDPRAEGAMK